jgi:hypothetical protein
MSQPNLAKGTSGAIDIAAAPMPMPSEWEADPGVCRVRIAPLKEFNYSGTVVALAEDVFDALGLKQEPWVEITTPAGIRMGAMAVRKSGDQGLVYIRRTMAWALEIGGQSKTFVKVRPVKLVNDVDEGRELVFTATRQLAEPYCESWYAVGIGLRVMEQANLTPGSYAIAKGPSGYQSVKIQVMDRGNPDEIWLSGKVRTAIGVDDTDDKVTLYPRHPLSKKDGATPGDANLVSR